jgi:hypothetical protein
MGRARGRAFTCSGLVDRRDAEIRVTRDQYRGHEVVYIRVWFIEQGSGQWKSSGRGLQFDEKRLEAVIEGLQQARSCSVR